MTYTLAFPTTRFGLDVQRLFDDVLAPASSRAATSWSPRTVSREQATAWTLELEIPGIAPEQIELVAEGANLIVRGEKPAREGSAPLKFQRAFTLPDGADSENIAANHALGVLTISIPKRAAAVARKIEIASN